jgi:regulator of RNase E activity RraA
MRVYGPAFTVAMLPAGSDPGTVGDFVDEVPEGAVVVIDARGRTDATVWGDLLTEAARRRGIAGTVIDGVCRDSERTVQLEYPIFTRGRTMRTGKSRLGLAGTQVPVAIGAVRVEPGDLILGDGDGILVVPASRHREVARAAREIAAAENRIRRAITAGESLAEARSRTGYHQLQERR